MTAPDVTLGPPGAPDDPFTPFEGPGAGPGASPTMLAELEAELATDVSRSPVLIPVPNRPGWSIRVRADVSLPELEGWRARASKGGRMNQLTWSELIIGGTTTALCKDMGDGQGPQEVVEGGLPVTFRSAWLQQATKTASALDAVRKFFGTDGHLTGAAVEVLRASGWDDELKPLDPTNAG